MSATVPPTGPPLAYAHTVYTCADNSSASHQCELILGLLIRDRVNCSPVGILRGGGGRSRAEPLTRYLTYMSATVTLVTRVTRAILMLAREKRDATKKVWRCSRVTRVTRVTQSGV